jgi:hypothetical protein
MGRYFRKLRLNSESTFRGTCHVVVIPEFFFFEGRCSYVWGKSGRNCLLCYIQTRVVENPSKMFDKVAKVRWH